MSVLFEEALKLPNDERRKLAYDLIETLDDPEEKIYLTPEQEAELQRRVEEHEKHPEDAIPWEEAWERLRTR
ncbi:MAG: addiction module protein [Chloracidobacterium sp.]|nr:addiction module protein [Chloracidobacterium sp.]